MYDILFHTTDWVFGKFNHSEDLRTKGKLSLYIMKAYCRMGGITPLILILGTSPLGKQCSVPTEKKAGWAPELVLMLLKKRKISCSYFDSNPWF
jgi:hypothetical protein